MEVFGQLWPKNFLAEMPFGRKTLGEKIWPNNFLAEKLFGRNAISSQKIPKT